MCVDQRDNCVHGDPGAGRPLGGDGANGYSGFVVVRLARDLAPGDAKTLREYSEKRRLAGLARLLDALEDPETARVVTSLPVRELLELEKEATRSELPPLHSLTSYWRIDCRRVDADLDEVVRALNELPEVDLAYREFTATDPTVNAADDTWNAGQNYLDAAPTGIDARWAWQIGRAHV